MRFAIMAEPFVVLEKRYPLTNPVTSISSYTASFLLVTFQRDDSISTASLDDQTKQFRVPQRSIL